MKDVKVSVPLSYLDDLIRENTSLNCALIIATDDLKKLEQELEIFKKTAKIPPVQKNSFSPPDLSPQVENEIMRLFVMGRDYSERRYSSYHQIRQILKEEFPDNRINAIKKVRELTGSSLKEAKEFYEGSNVLLYTPRL